MGAQSSFTAETLDLSEARVAYEMALAKLEQALPKADDEPLVVDPAEITWARVLLRTLVLFPLAFVRGFMNLFQAIGREVDDTLRSTKGRLVRFVQRKPAVLGGAEIERRKKIRQLLLEVLWARDHVQYAIERQNGASYDSKRSVLSFVMANEGRLQRLGQRALEVADLETSELRESQPTPPNPEHWWWFLNYPRARRARRLNTVWFVLAFLPGMASIILITLLAQRLAINGPDLLSGASVIAQVGLGLGSILAGREILEDLLRSGVSGAWQGQIVFTLASLFLIVIVAFYFAAPPGAAMVYNIFGQRAIDAGNAAEAELYLESAARLDPDPYAASLLEVGCLYQTLGSPDRAQSVFERVLEADSRLLLARYHLAELYSDQGQYAKALQLLEDGLNLLTAAKEEMAAGNDDFLPQVKNADDVAEMEYLLRLARGRAYLDNAAPEKAQGNLLDASDLFDDIAARAAANGAMNGVLDRSETACGPDDDIVPFIITTEMNLHYHLARTYDALCDDDATVQAALLEWRWVRNSRSSGSRQDTWIDEATRRLDAARLGLDCTTNYGLDGPRPVEDAAAPPASEG